MKTCKEICQMTTSACKQKDCRMWMEYESDLNCALVAIENNKDEPMTLREIAERMGVSFVRIKQIEEKALKNLKKKLKKDMKL